MNELLQLDAELFLKINVGLSNGFFDWFMPIIRNMYVWIPLYIFIVVFCIKKYKKTGLYIIGMLLLTFALGDLTSARLIKPNVQRLRPCNNPELSAQMIKRVTCGTGYSFPSSHATNHFAIAVFLICVFYKQWKAILPIGLTWAAMICLAQIYVGVHYPIDIITGTLLGTSIGLLTAYIYAKIKPAT